MEEPFSPQNPYAPPRSESFSELPVDAAAIRARLSSKEALLRLLGVYFLILGVVRIYNTRLVLMAGVRAESSGEAFKFLLPVLAIWVFSALLFNAGIRLTRLNTRGRTSAIIVTVVLVLSHGLTTLRGLGQLSMGVPEAGSLVSSHLPSLVVLALFLRLLLSADGKLVLSQEYRTIVAATPQVVWLRTPGGVFGLLALLAYLGSLVAVG